MIRIKAYQVPQLIETVYNMSVPVGMGYLHYKAGNIDKKTIDALIHRFEERLKWATSVERPEGYPWPETLVTMDYVNGRQCKFNVSYFRGEIVINDGWYDHTEFQFEELLLTCGIDINDKLILENLS